MVKRFSTVSDTQRGLQNYMEKRRWKRRQRRPGGEEQKSKGETERFPFLSLLSCSFILVIELKRGDGNVCVCVCVCVCVLGSVCVCVCVCVCVYKLENTLRCQWHLCFLFIQMLLDGKTSSTSRTVPSQNSLTNRFLPLIYTEFSPSSFKIKAFLILYKIFSFNLLVQVTFIFRAK